MHLVEGDHHISDLRIVRQNGDHAVLPASAALLLSVVLNRRSRRPVCLLIPDTRQVAELCALLAAFQWLRDDFAHSKAAFLKEGLPRNSYVRSTRDGLVYQVGDTDSVGTRLLFIASALKASSGSRIISREETLGFERTLRRRPMAQPRNEKLKPRLTAMDFVAGVETYGNTCVLKNRTILLGAREEFERFLSSTCLSRTSDDEAGIVLSDAFCWGAITDTGYAVEQPSGAGGEPLVAITRDISLLRQKFADKPSDRFETTIVTSQTSSVLNRLEDVDRIAQNQRFVLFSESRRRGEVANLAESGWNVWELQPWELAVPGQRHSPTGLIGIDASVRAAEFEINKVVRDRTAKCAEFEAVSDTLDEVSRLLGAPDIEDDPNASECLKESCNLFFSLGRWLSFPSGEDNSTVRKAISGLRTKAPGVRIVAGQQAVAAVQAMADAALRFLNSGSPGMPTPKGEKLLGSRAAVTPERVGDMVVVTAHSRCANAARSFLQTHDLAIPCSSAANMRQLSPSSIVVLLNAMWRQKFDAIFDPWPVRSVMLCGYACEVKRYRRWLHFRETSRTRLWPDVGIRVAIAGVPSDKLPARREAEGSPATPIAPSIELAEDAFERATRPKANDWSRRATVPTGEYADTSMAQFCRFVGTSWTAFSEDHLVTKLSIDANGRQYVSRTEVSELRPGDRVVMREHGQKDAIRQLAEAEVGADRYAILKTAAGHWRRALNGISLSARDVAERLAVYGLRRNVSTIQSWLKNAEMIGPKSKEDLFAIFEAFAPNDDPAKWEACWEAIREVRSTHISAGNALSSLISEQCRGMLLEDAEEEVKVTLPAGDAWVLEVGHIEDKASRWPSAFINHLQWEGSREDSSRLTLADLGL